MRRMHRLGWLALLTVSLWILVVPPAHAYIDPGSTSLLFTWIIGAVAAVGMTLKLTWHRLAHAFRRRPGAPAESEPVSAEVE